MAARRPFWKWHRWKSIGFCLWPPSTCIWNLKLKFQSKLDLCSGNHVVYRQTDGQTDRRTDGQTDKVNPVYPPSNFVGWGYKNKLYRISLKHPTCYNITKYKDYKNKLSSILKKKEQERRQTPKYPRLPRSVYVQSVETVKQSGPLNILGT